MSPAYASPSPGTGNAKSRASAFFRGLFKPSSAKSSSLTPTPYVYRGLESNATSQAPTSLKYFNDFPTKEQQNSVTSRKAQDTDLRDFPKPWSPKASAYPAYGSDAAAHSAILAYRRDAATHSAIPAYGSDARVSPVYPAHQSDARADAAYGSDAAAHTPTSLYFNDFPTKEQQNSVTSRKSQDADLPKPLFLKASAPPAYGSDAAAHSAYPAFGSDARAYHRVKQQNSMTSRKFQDARLRDFPKPLSPKAGVYSADGSGAAAHSEELLNFWDFSRPSSRNDFPTMRAAFVHLVEQRNWVNSVCFSPDGLRAISGSSDNTASIWDVSTGGQLHKLEGHDGWVNSVSFSPDGLHAVSGSNDNTACIWDVVTGQLLQKLEGHNDWVSSVSFSPNGLHVISGSNDNTACIWDVVTGELLQKLEGHKDWVNSVNFSPDGLRAISGSSDNTARIWDVSTGDQLQKLAGHKDWVNSVSFSANCLHAISGSNDNTACIWDVVTGALLQKLEGHKNWVNSVNFSSDGLRAISGSSDNTARIWEVSTGDQLHELESHDGWVNSVGFSPDGLHAISGSSDDTAHIWDVSTGKRLHRLEGHVDTVNSVSFSPDGLCAISGSNDGTVCIWDVYTGKKLQQVKGQNRSVSLSPERLHAISDSDDMTEVLGDSAAPAPKTPQHSTDPGFLPRENQILENDGARTFSPHRPGQADLDNSEDSFSTFVIYSPESSPPQPSNHPGLLPEDIQTLENEFCGGGRIFSTHSPDDALLWVEAHYDDTLLEEIRNHGLGGPVAAMLSPNESALVIFGSISDDWVLEGAKLLSDTSQFMVMIRPRGDDPVTKWNCMTEDSGPRYQGSNDSHEDREETQSMTDSEASVESFSTDSDTDSDIGSGVFRPRGGTRRKNPWVSPAHNLDVHLRVKSDVECQVAILSKMQFTVQSKYTDEIKRITRPQAISRTRLRVIPSNRDVWPDRSHSRMVFLAHGYISECTPLPCEGYIRPNQTTKKIKMTTKGITTTGTLTGSINPTGALAIAGNYAQAQSIENQNDRVTPNWIVDYEDGGWGDSEGQYYWEQNVSYTATDNRQHQMQVEFSMGINVQESSKGILPDTSFVIQNQTMLWMRHKSLKSQGYGMIVLTSSYIPDISIENELSIKEAQTVELAGNSVPRTDKTKGEYPVPMSLSIGVAPAMEKLSWGHSILKKLAVKSAAQTEESPAFQISKLPVDDFKARGWDAKTERWRMPAYPSWGTILKQVTKDPTHNLPKSKGKQRDPGPTPTDNLPSSKGKERDPGLTTLEETELQEGEVNVSHD